MSTCVNVLLSCICLEVRKYTNVSERSDALSAAMQYKFVTDTK